MNEDEKRKRASEYGRRYRLKNLEKVRAYYREYRQKQREKDPEASNRYYHENKERIRANKVRYRESEKGKAMIRELSLKKKYGLDLSGYNVLLLEQKGVCGLCGTPPAEGEVLAVDHDHEDGRIRGLLHRECNVVLGSVHEDVEILRRAIAYLEAGGHPGVVSLAKGVILTVPIRKPGRPRIEEDDKHPK